MPNGRSADAAVPATPPRLLCRLRDFSSSMSPIALLIAECATESAERSVAAQGGGAKGTRAGAGFGNRALEPMP